MDTTRRIGGATAIYICPQCGCPDVLVEDKALITNNTSTKAQCPGCGWTGVARELVTLATTERVFDSKAVLSSLIYVANKHAAGPVAQALQLFGFIEKDDAEGLDTVMKAATEGLVTAAFMAAAERATQQGTVQLKVERKTCPWCGGRHVLGEEHDFVTGAPVHCKKCGGAGTLTESEIAALSAEEDRAVLSQGRKQAVLILWEHHIKQPVLELLKNAAAQDLVVSEILVPNYVYQVWVSANPEQMLGFRLGVSETDTFELRTGHELKESA